MAVLVKTLNGLAYASCKTKQGLDMASIKTINGLDVTSGSFSPTDIAGCTLWLQADGITGLSDGDPVATWEDDSGNANDATQSTSILRPTYQTSEINGLPYVDFGGADAHLATSAAVQTSLTYSIFLVMRASATSGTKVLTYNGTSAANGYGPIFFGGNRANLHGGLGVLSDGTATTNAEMWSIIRDSVCLLRVNGSSVAITAGGTPNAPSTATYIGGNAASGQSLSGGIAEVIIYDSALSDTDRDSVELYLSTKYAL